ncbi:MAG TPA: hypothetical protein DIS94_08240 [Bacteroidetes bacterium]|nr:hypothetical protein [Bacteroidota bacterium]
MITILKISNEEVADIVPLLKELYMELGEESESIEFLNENLINEILYSGLTDIYLAKYDNEKVGIFTLTENQAIYAGGKYGSLDEMYVIPEYRNKNIGKLMIDKIKEIGKEKSWERIDVTAPTEKIWERTVHFYKNNGFVFTGPKLKLKINRHN